jgi:hypothetical protein
MSGLTASQQAIFQQATDRWEQVIIGDLPDAIFQGQTVDDVLIAASSVVIDGEGGILGQAGPDAFRSNLLPIHGIMQFDTADMASMEQDGTLFGVIMHEIGHVLGIGTLWQSFGLLVGAGTSNPIFRGAQATAAYNEIFGTSASGVPVENTGGPGTRDGHFRESILDHELMTGYAEYGAMPLSRITIGSLADIGYQVNFAAADAYTRPASVMAFVPSLVNGTTAHALMAPPIGLASHSAATTVANSGIAAAGLSQDSVDAVMTSGRVRVGEPSVPQSSEARIAVFESWDMNSEQDDSEDAATAHMAQAALDSVWDDLAADLLETAMV